MMRKEVERRIRNDVREFIKTIAEDCIDGLITIHEYLNPILADTLLRFPEYRLRAWIYQLKVYRREVR
jgi:hypothetical protein